jgi:hypothetical protein
MFDFSEPIGFTIFCDDIRQEMGGKISLIGIYSGIMFIHRPFPTTLAKFGFHIELFEPAELAAKRDFPIEISVRLPGDDEGRLFFTVSSDPEQVKATLDDLPWQPLTGEGPLLAQMRFNQIVSPFVIQEPGLIQVRAKYKDDEIKCGTLRVEAGDPDQRPK